RSTSFALPDRPTFTSNTTSIVCNAWRASSRTPSRRICRRSPTCSSPTTRGATSPARARSITASCSASSTRSATTAGSVANTSRRATPSKASRGARHTVFDIERTHGDTANMGNLGFIGLGIMGAPMAGHLIKGGHQVFLHSRSGVPASLTEAGGKRCASGKEVAQRVDIIITMVPDTPDVEKALFGPDGVVSGLSKGKIVVDMSSISPLATKAFAQKINALGCEYLDAPVSGGEVGAKAASLTIMVGGSEATFAKVKPLFERMGKNITLVGGNGDGQTTKVANQIIV